MKRKISEYCLSSTFGDFRSEVEKKYGKPVKGVVSCPDCGRNIKLRKGNGVAYLLVPAHLKPEALG